ncbi:MAG TPA: hypothetical protein VMV94_20470 [Phycisphaerae bacterium]|nr:hypothetical protein [Phycisphaerae bacterium]
MASEPLSKIQRSFRATDAHGRRVPMLDPYTLHLLRRHDIIPAEPLALMAREIGSGLDPKMRRLLIILGVIAAFSTVVFIIFSTDVLIHRQYGRLVEKWPLLLCQGWIWPLICWLQAKRVRYKRIQAVMLKYRHCPHCGYDIRELPTDSADGTTRCPECGCAWLLLVPEDGAQDQVSNGA